MRAPRTIETDRLLLRPPDRADAGAIFERYASDAEVTRYVSFRRHTSIDETRRFLEWSRQEWERWPAGPYLIFSRDPLLLLGGTGLKFETPNRVEVGYVLAHDAWGRGVATEALAAMVDLATGLGVERLVATCHPDHRASQRVLEKCGFELETTLESYLVFPNLDPEVRADVYLYVHVAESGPPG